MEKARMHYESLDLAKLTDRLRGVFKARLPVGYLQGKTEIRDAVAGLLDCSLLEAEMLVDQLESQRLIQFEGDPKQEPSLPMGWIFR